MSARLLVDCRCTLGEGILWDVRRSAWLWTDIEGRRLWQHRPAEGLTRQWTLPDRLGSFALCASGRILLGLAKSLAKQWGKYGITANTVLVAPQLVVAGDAGQRLADGVSLSVPALGRLADPADDLAPVVALLASDDAHYATGSTLMLDGGVWLVH